LSNSHSERLDEIEQRLAQIDSIIVPDGESWSALYGDEHDELHSEYMELAGKRYNT
jgi:hypothetical protein